MRRPTCFGSREFQFSLLFLSSPHSFLLFPLSAAQVRCSACDMDVRQHRRRGKAGKRGSEQRCLDADWQQPRYLGTDDSFNACKTMLRSWTLIVRIDDIQNTNAFKTGLMMRAAWMLTRLRSSWTSDLAATSNGWRARA